MTASRRLAAILAADVAGYSRLMGADEEGTHERLKAHLSELVNPKIAEHQDPLQDAPQGSPFLMVPHTASPTIFFGTIFVVVAIGAFIPLIFGKETVGQLETVTEGVPALA